MGLVCSQLNDEDIPFPMRLVDDIRRFGNGRFHALADTFMGSGSPFFLDDLSDASLSRFRDVLSEYVDWEERAFNAAEFEKIVSETLSAIREVERRRCPN